MNPNQPDSATQKADLVPDVLEEGASLDSSVGATDSEASETERKDSSSTGKLQETALPLIRFADVVSGSGPAQKGACAPSRYTQTA